MTNTCLLCAVVRNCMKRLFVLALLLTTCFAYADSVPSVLPVDTQSVAVNDSAARANYYRQRKSRIKVFRKIAERCPSAREWRFMYIVNKVFFIIVMLCGLFAKKKKERADTAEDDLLQNAPQKKYGGAEETPVIDIDNLGMRSRLILKMLFAIIIVVTGVSLVVVCSKELFACVTLWQPMTEQGLDPKALLLKDLIQNALETLLGIVILVVGIVSFFSIMKQQKSTIEEEENMEDVCKL